MATLRVSKYISGNLSTRLIDSYDLASYLAAGWAYPAVDSATNYRSEVVISSSVQNIRDLDTSKTKLCLLTTTRELYYFDPFSNSTDNGTSILKPTSGTGAWLICSTSGGSGGGSTTIEDGSVTTVKLGGDITPDGKELLKNSGVVPTFIQSIDPAISGKYLWVQTLPGGDHTIWFEDGV